MEIPPPDLPLEQLHQSAVVLWMTSDAHALSPTSEQVRAARERFIWALRTVTARSIAS